jgi:hypothetical protein
MNDTPAFPTPLQHSDWREDYPGMTLRDYFAAKAMQALIDNDGLFVVIPAQAYAIADVMMKAREKK